MLLALMASCNQDAVESVDDSFFGSATRANGKPLEIDYSSLDTYYFVTDKDVESYIHFKKLLAEGEKREFEVREVVPLGVNDEATLAYLLNYNDGWEIIAADKRAPAVLASNEKGSCNFKELPMNMKAWIQNMELDLLQLRTCSQRPKWADEDSWQKMTESIRFWSAINAEEEFVMGQDSVTTGTRSLPSGHEIKLPDLTGHWELVSVTTREDVLDYVNHLITTHWHQNAPFNANCPESIEHPGEHVPAGSIVVSGASLLYFFHNTIGWPEERPVYSTYSGNIMGWNYEPGYMSSTGWELLSADDEEDNDFVQAVASYYAYIGHEIQVVWDENVTCGSNTSFVTSLIYFGNEDVLYDHDGYSANAVIESVQEGSPILTEIIQYHDYNVYEQSFLIDYYRKFRSSTNYYYEFIYDNPSTLPRPLQDSVRTVYSSGNIEKIRMKWGDNPALDNTDYSLSATWNYCGFTYSISQSDIYYNFRERLYPIIF